MRDDKIIIEPFALLNILTFTMRKQVNRHSEIRFAGHIDESCEVDYMKESLEGMWVKVMVRQSMEPEERKDTLQAMQDAPIRPAIQTLLGKSFIPNPDKVQAAAIEELARQYGNQKAQASTQPLQQTAGVSMPKESLKVGNVIEAHAVGQLGDVAAFLPLLKAPDALDVANALGASGVLKEKGFRNIVLVLNKMKSSGLLDALEQKGPEAAANSDAALKELSAKKILLQGVLTDFRIDVENGVKVARGIVMSGTALMDTMPHIRTWHAPDTTYDKIIRTYLPAYPKGAYAMTEEDKAIEGLTVQYRETDWEFTVRMASRFNSFVIPNDATKDETENKEGEAEPGAKFYFGMPDFEAVEIVKDTYTMHKNVQEFRDKRDNQVPDILEKDAIYTIVKSRDVYPLGGQVKLGDQTLYIAVIDSALDGSELYHRYYLKSKNGFREPLQYNFKLLGASLPAKVNAVTGDVIEVAVLPDENQAGAGFRWLPYSTVYSTEDGTGWYCMPEPGDAVRLYLPDEDEANGYVISSTHLISAAKDERVNPDFKSIMNKQGKEVLFTPGSVTFTNNAGMAIELIDSVGIRIVSDKQINLVAQEKVTISSATATMEINAPEKITVYQNGTFTNLADDLVIKGKRVFIE